MSLLDCAIAASLAVVPVMLGALALVAWLRPAEAGAGARPLHPGHYLSIRHVAALKTFEHAVAPRRDDTLVVVTSAQVLDGLAPCRDEWGGGNEVVQWLRRFGAGGSAPASPADAVAARLTSLDAALLRFSSRDNRRVTGSVGIDAAQWFAAAREALETPLATRAAPDLPFRVRCADLAGALSALQRGDAGMLDALAWRGSVGAATLARWRPEQLVQVGERDVMRRNPWSGIAGCIYLGAGHDGASGAPSHFIAGPHSAQRRLCGLPALSGAVAAAGSAAAPAPLALPGEPGLADAASDPRWMVPPSLAGLLQPLESLRQPTGALYLAYTGDAAPNRVVLDGAAVDVGYSVDLTIDPALQALAQKTAACYTGRHDVCAALGLRRSEDGDRPLGERLLEGAMVRMAAIAVIDVGSGRIEALAGALSPCARQEVDGPGRGSDCDTRLPYPVRFRADAQRNPAVYHDAMPASTIKPILAAAFLAEPGRGERLLAVERAASARDGVPAAGSLRAQLMRSDSARFLDRMFCLDGPLAGCRRAWDVQAAAPAFGWNAGCAEGLESCGKADLLFGRPLPLRRAPPGLEPGPLPVAYGRLLSEPVGGKAGAPMHLMPFAGFDAAVVRRCAEGADGRRVSDDDWERCRGASFVDVVAEGWGQGHARASALGVAGMMTALAAAANGAASAPRPHLVAGVRGVAGPATDAVRADAARWAAAAPPAPPRPLQRDAAEVILSGLSYSHRAGTARTACEQVFDARRCQGIDWLAGKTGTPSFPGDGLTLDQLARDCRADAARPAGVRRGACGALRPYKWYVAAFRADRASRGPWTKVIAVLAERNWLRADGRVHGTGDHGPNPAAEMALQVVARHTGAMGSTAP